MREATEGTNMTTSLKIQQASYQELIEAEYELESALGRGEAGPEHEDTYTEIVAEIARREGTTK